MKIISFIALISIFALPGFAQGDEKQASLQGITEAILVNNQPLIRVLTRKNGHAEIFLTTRDGEEAFVFTAWKVPNKSGLLVVSRSKVVFNPDGNATNFFSYVKSQIKKTELVEKSKIFTPTSLARLIVIPDDKKYVYARFTNDGENNKEYALPANTFILKAINDFDAAVAEYKELTKDVRPVVEKEEEEEDAEPEVSDRFDRFQEITIISTSKMTLRSGSRSIRFGAQFDFPGRVQKRPENATLTFIASAPRAAFREDSLKLNFLIDGERVPMPNVKIADEQESGSGVRQTVAAVIPFEVLERMAKAKTVEFQLGTYEQKLTEVQIKALAKLVAYRVE